MAICWQEKTLWPLLLQKETVDLWFGVFTSAQPPTSECLLAFANFCPHAHTVSTRPYFLGPGYEAKKGPYIFVHRGKRLIMLEVKNLSSSKIGSQTVWVCDTNRVCVPACVRALQASERDVLRATVKPLASNQDTAV